VLHRLRGITRLRSVLSGCDCMYWVPDEDIPPSAVSKSTPFLCIGCKKCSAKAPTGISGRCPWDAIEMVPIEDVEAQIGVKMPI